MNSVAVAYVGEEMLRQGKYAEHDAIYVPSKVDIGLAYDIHPGTYLKKGEDSDSETFMPGGVDPGNIQKSMLADPWRALMTIRGKPQLCVVNVFNIRGCEEAVYERKTEQVLTQDSFQRTLIYSGRVGDKVNIGYREFSSNTARPAFNNDVEYDLATSTTVGYRGARLEIIEATNELIRYRVISNFNNAGL